MRFAATALLLLLGATGVHAQSRFGRWGAGDGKSERGGRLALHGGYHPAPTYLRGTQTSTGGIIGGLGGGAGTLDPTVVKGLFNVQGGLQAGFELGARYWRLSLTVTADRYTFEQTGYIADLTTLGPTIQQLAAASGQPLDAVTAALIARALGNATAPLKATLTPVGLEIGYAPLVTRDWTVALGIGATHTAQEIALVPTVANFQLDLLPSFGKGAFGGRARARAGWRMLYAEARYDYAPVTARLVGQTEAKLQTGGVSLLAGAALDW